MNNIQAENLFRRQAIESLRHKVPGRPICLMPRSWTWLGFLVCILFLSAAIFLGTVDYARKESVRGWLVSTPGVIRVAHGSPAVVQRIVRHAGERVEAGEALIYLSGDSLLSGGNSKLDELLLQLRQDLLEVDSQLELSRLQEEMDSGSLQMQLRKSDAEIASLVEQINEQKRQVAVSRDQLQRLQLLLRQRFSLGIPERRFSCRHGQAPRGVRSARSVVRADGLGESRVAHCLRDSSNVNPVMSTLSRSTSKTVWFAELG